MLVGLSSVNPVAMVSLVIVSVSTRSHVSCSCCDISGPITVPFHCFSHRSSMQISNRLYSSFQGYVLGSPTFHDKKTKFWIHDKFNGINGIKSRPYSTPSNQVLVPYNYTKHIALIRYGIMSIWSYE